MQQLTIIFRNHPKLSNSYLSGKANNLVFMNDCTLRLYYSKHVAFRQAGLSELLATAEVMEAPLT
jgi:hypothetical protein